MAVSRFVSWFSPPAGTPANPAGAGREPLGATFEKSSIMDKQKNHSLVKRYISFFAFCVFILIIGDALSVPIKVEVRSVGDKPPFLFALFFSVILLASAIGGFYGSYLYWFQETKSRANLQTSMERLAQRSFLFRLPIYNPKFLFWYIRLTLPMLALFLLGLFLLVVSSAF